jgi:hypothetical protein
MIHVYNDPLLLDFLKVCYLMPEGERAQLEAFTGQKYTVDGAAVGNFTVNGPKWVIKDAEVPLVVGGFSMERPGVWRDFLLSTPDAWSPKYWFSITRICRKIMDGMLKSGTAHRLECVVPAARLSAKLEGWYKLLGYNREGLLNGYCANGADAVIFSRVRH